MENHLTNNLVAAEELIVELLLAVEPAKQSDIEIIEASVRLDLAEFQLTPQEIIKLTRILSKLDLKLSDALSQVCPAVSVVSDIQQKITALSSSDEPADLQPFSTTP